MTRMINLVLGLVMAGSFTSVGFAAAQRSKATALQAAKVLEASVITTHLGRGVSQQVVAKISYGNDCVARHSTESYLLDPSMSINDRELKLVLATQWKSGTACTAEYKPVTRIVSVGSFTHPADGAYDQVIVNGVVAVEVDDEQHDRVCTMIAGVLYNPSTGHCASFTNGCELNRLQDLGYTEPQNGLCAAF
jgi:hypothetical protein